MKESYEKRIQFEVDENARLRDGIKEILDVYDENLTDIQVARKMRRIAKELLEK